MITIGIVLYNEEKHFELIEANLKLLAAYPTEFFPIVVNNASTDETGNRLVALRRQVSFLYVDRMQNNLGAARAEVVDQAQGEWVGFIDADCLISELWLERVLSLKNQFVDKPTSVDPSKPYFLKEQWAGFGGPWSPSGAWGENYKCFFSYPFVQILFPQFRVQTSSSVVSHIPTANVVYVKQHILNVGQFSPQMAYVGEDLDLNLRLSRAGYKFVLDGGASIQHYLPEEMKSWCKKIFYYGCGRVSVACKNKQKWNFILVAPLLFLFIFMGLTLWTRGYFLISYALILGLVALRPSPHNRSLPVVWGLLFWTPLMYSFGMAFQWLKTAGLLIPKLKTLFRQIGTAVK